MKKKIQIELIGLNDKMEIHLLVLKLERRLGHKDVKLPLMTADVKDV